MGFFPSELLHYILVRPRSTLSIAPGRQRRPAAGVDFFAFARWNGHTAASLSNGGGVSPLLGWNA